MKAIMFVKSILKRSSTVIVDEDPVYCPSCSSHRMTRIRRTNFDIRLGVQKRFECGTCYRFALVSGQGNVAEENTTLVDSKADKEEGLSPISQCDLELQQANDQLRSELQLAKNEYERTFAEKTESADEDLDKLRVALEAAKAELSDNEIQIE